MIGPLDDDRCDLPADLVNPVQCFGEFRCDVSLCFSKRADVDGLDRELLADPSLQSLTRTCKPFAIKYRIVTCSSSILGYPRKDMSDYLAMSMMISSTVYQLVMKHL